MSSPPVVVDPRLVAEEFHRYLSRTGLAENTVGAYSQYAGQYCAWLAAQGEPYERALRDEDYRDWAVRDWRRTLIEQHRAPATVDLALTAVKQLYQHLGLGPPKLRATQGRFRTAPKALTVDEQKWVLRAAEKRGPRDLALVTVGMMAGLRLGEITALDVWDVRILERVGQVQVRHGKGARSRTVPLNRQAREALAGWLRVRAGWGADTDAVFLARASRGRPPRRIDDRTVQHALSRIKVAAGVEVLSPHVLRHTFATNLLQSGAADLVTVRDLLGHESVETTAIYTRPSGERMGQVVDALTVDY